MHQVPISEAQGHHWPILEPLEGSRERPVALNKPVCVVGDRARVNLPLPSPIVSRAHVLLLRDGHGVYLRDLASLNHVFVNDTAVREAELDDGDVVRIGPYAFRCQAGFEHNGNGNGNGNGADHHAPPAELREPDAGEHVPLSGRSMLIGTRGDCDLSMTDDAVSPAHAIIFERGGHHVLRDLRSPTGTFVNDRRVGQVDLHPGDLIRIGRSEFRYELCTHDDTAFAHVLPLESESSSDTSALPVEQESKPEAVHAAEQASAPVEDEPAAAAVSDEAIPLADEPSVEAMGPVDDAEQSSAAAPESAAASSPDPASESGIIPLLAEPEISLSPAVPQPMPRPRAADPESGGEPSLADDDVEFEVRPVRSKAPPPPDRDTARPHAPHADARQKKDPNPIAPAKPRPRQPKT